MSAHDARNLGHKEIALNRCGLPTSPGSNCEDVAMAADRFLTLADVAEVLNISISQTYALVRNGDLEAIKIGGRGQWRVERDKLEDYITRMYDQTRTFVAAHPLVEDEVDTANDSADIHSRTSAV
jgi:excisionase family DNA binding protein